MGPDSSRRLFPLTSCSIGIWTPGEGTRAYLLLCPDRKQFVVLLTRDADGRARRRSSGSLSVNHLLAGARSQAALWLRHKNPFIDHTQQPGVDTGVLTFEVGFEDVVGMDFRWPLTDEPRLVLEAAILHKRVFASVDEVCSHYPPIRHRRVLRGSTAPSPVPEEQEQQHAQLAAQQQQQQAAGGGASDGAGGGAASMSRVSSWTSWASWTIGSARPSLELTPPAAGAAAAAAAHAATPATEAAPDALQNAGFASAFSGAAGAGGECDAHAAVGKTSCCTGKQQQQEQQQHALPTQSCELPCCSTHRLARAAGAAGSSSDSPPCPLATMVSLQAGMGASSAACDTADTAAGCPQDTAATAVLASGRTHSGSVSVSSTSDAGVVAMVAACGRLKPAGAARSAGNGRARRISFTSLPASADSTPRAIAAGSAASDTCEATQELAAALLDVAAPEPSFGVWQPQLEALRPCWQQQEEGKEGEGEEQCGGLQLLADVTVANSGAVTAPCTMPSSPRSGQQGATAAAAAAAPEHLMARLNLRVFEQQQLQQQQHQEAACHQHRQQARLHASCGGSAKRSLRSRLAASGGAGAADAACPLCHQELLAPLAVLQQRFHQQQDHKQQRLAARHGARGSSSGKGPVQRSRSACSLLQLQQQHHEQQQQQQQHRHHHQQRAGTAGGIENAPLPGQSHNKQHQQQQQQECKEGGAQLPPQSFAGLAAAAMGVLAARCRPEGVGGGASSSSSHQPAGRDHERGIRGSRRGSHGELAQAVGAEDESVEAVAAAIADAALKQALACTTTAAANNSSRGGGRGRSAAGSGVSGAPSAGGQSQACAAAAAARDSADAAPGVELAARHRSSSGGGSAGGAAGLVGSAQQQEQQPQHSAGSSGAALTADGSGVRAADPAPAGAAGVGAGAAVSAAGQPDAEAAACSKQQQAEQDGRPRHGSYSNRTVVLTFTDPTLPYQLSKLVKNESNVHLLKLYESGLPAWAIVLPSYGLWYRPWLRRVTWLLFVLLSVVSMAMGFYDLYKNVPYFKQVVVHMFRPAAQIFEWLEGHTQFRLSILLTYMVGKSQLLVQLIKLLTTTSLAPLLAPFSPLITAVAAAAAAVRAALLPVVTALRMLLGPLARLLWLLASLLWQVVSTLLWFGPLQLVSLAGSGLLGLLQLLLLPLQAVLPAGASLRAGWSAAKATGQVARSAAPVVASAARGAAASAASASGSAWWWWWWGPLEALELMRASTVRVARALQAVLRFFVTLASTVNQHRLSLLVQLRGKLWGGLQAAAASPAGRVASVVAHRMGQGERLARVQRDVARRLHRHDSLASMGSEALGGSASLGPLGSPLSPAAATPLLGGAAGRHHVHGNGYGGGRGSSASGGLEDAPLFGLLMEEEEDAEGQALLDGAGAGVLKGRGAPHGRPRMRQPGTSEDADEGGDAEEEEVSSVLLRGHGGGGGSASVPLSPAKPLRGSEGLRLRAAARAAVALSGAAGGGGGALPPSRLAAVGAAAAHQPALAAAAAAAEALWLLQYDTQQPGEAAAPAPPPYGFGRLSSSSFSGPGRAAAAAASAAGGIGGFSAGGGTGVGANSRSYEHLAMADAGFVDQPPAWAAPGGAGAAAAALQAGHVAAAWGTGQHQLGAAAGPLDCGTSYTAAAGLLMMPQRRLHCPPGPGV